MRKLAIISGIVLAGSIAGYSYFGDSQTIETVEIDLNGTENVEEILKQYDVEVKCRMETATTTPVEICDERIVKLNDKEVKVRLKAPKSMNLIKVSGFPFAEKIEK